MYYKAYLQQMQQRVLVMEGEQIPKATMSSFVRKNVQANFNSDFVSSLLFVSKEFISRLSDTSNQICELNNKKTINADHLEAALGKFGLTNHLQQLKQLGSNIKESNELRRQANKKIEEMIAFEREKERQRRKLEEPQKKMVIVRERFEQLQESNNEDYSCDYQELARESQNSQQHNHLQIQQ